MKTTSNGILWLIEFRLLTLICKLKIMIFIKVCVEFFFEKDVWSACSEEEITTLLNIHVQRQIWLLVISTLLPEQSDTIFHISHLHTSIFCAITGLWSLEWFFFGGTVSAPPADLGSMIMTMRKNKSKQSNYYYYHNVSFRWVKC